MNRNLSIEDEQKLLASLIDHFGITTAMKDGGFILPDGRFLDLQRSQEQTRMYHRSIANCIPLDMIGECDEITITNVLSVTGVIRYESTGRVHVAKAPTAIQRRRLFEIMKYSLHRYQILVSDSNGATIGEQYFQSPHAHELLAFFNQCFSSHADTRYRADEFYLSDEGENYALIFRTDRKIAGRYLTSNDTFTLEPSFVGVQALFESMVRAKQLTLTQKSSEEKVSGNKE